jgi:hypothetical protein
MTFALVFTRDGRTLTDADTLAHQLHVSKRSLRRHLRPVACDYRTRTNLYDADAAGDTLKEFKPRKARIREP